MKFDWNVTFKIGSKSVVAKNTADVANGFEALDIAMKEAAPKIAELFPIPKFEALPDFDKFEVSIKISRRL